MSSADLLHETQSSDTDKLRADNADLRNRLQALEEIVAKHPANQGQDAWIARQHEYESLLEEKTEVIRALHLQLQELRDKDSSPTAAQPNDGGSDAAGQLDALQRELEESRRQLTEDEESLMRQMRAMEMAMSRERAEMARQRTELQRLHSDLKHELDVAARNAGLRERLLPLQRRHQDIATRKGG